MFGCSSSKIVFILLIIILTIQVILSMMYIEKTNPKKIYLKSFERYNKSCYKSLCFKYYFKYIFEVFLNLFGNK